MGRKITQQYLTGFLFILVFALFAITANAQSIQVDTLRSADRSKVWTMPSITDTLAGVSSTQTLTNKTLTSPTINGGTVSGTTISNSTIGSSNSISSASISGSTITSASVSGSTISNFLNLTDQGSAPATPAAGIKSLYSKTAGVFYKDSAGTEYQVATTAGSGSFVDNQFEIYDNSDNTKKLNFQLSGITTATTRTVTIADANIEIGKPPTVQRLLSGTGATYTTPAGVRYIVVEMVGGGGGGSGGGSASRGAGGNGGNTTFGANTASGGTGGAAGTGGGTSQAGGAGGGTSHSLGTLLHSQSGITGEGFRRNANATSVVIGGADGGDSFFGGGGTGVYLAAGNAGLTNSGGGGAGGSFTSAVTDAYTGNGGGGGGYLKFMVTNPSSSYTYTIGTSGSAGTAGTNGAAGGAGGTGIIIVTEYYN